LAEHQGAAAVAASVTAAIKNLRNEAVPIYPVPCRIENAEAEKLDVAIRYARGVFAPFLNHVHPNFEQQSSYWKEVETPYVLFYAYEEVPAAFRDEPGSRRGVLAPNERIAYWITDHAVSAMHPQSEDDRKKVVEAYSFKNESTRSIERTPTQRGRLVDLLRWQLVRYRWRFATALAMTALFATVIVSMSQVFSLRSQLLFANAKVCEARQLVGVLQNSPSSNNQVLEAIKKILDDLSKSGSACGPAASEPAK
jgi:hypothetical protein